MLGAEVGAQRQSRQEMRLVAYLEFAADGSGISNVDIERAAADRDLDRLLQGGPIYQVRIGVHGQALVEHQRLGAELVAPELVRPIGLGRGCVAELGQPGETGRVGIGRGGAAEAEALAGGGVQARLRRHVVGQCDFRRRTRERGRLRVQRQAVGARVAEFEEARAELRE